MARVKQVKRSLTGDPEVLKGMFDEMMGAKDADESIILPKIINSRNLIKHIIKVLNQFATFTPLRQNFPTIKGSLDEINEFTERISAALKLTAEEEKQEKYASMSKTEMNAFYKSIKESDCVKTLVIMCSRLKMYSRYIDNLNELKDNFIGQEPGLSLRIFGFSSLDLKVLWASDVITASVKKYILTILHILYKKSHELYRVTTSPDVDVEKFSSVLIDAITNLKKHPELSRCNRAFTRIEKSVELLKNKFDGYYRESVACSNSNMILESFIIDVANQGSADPRLTREFRQIIQYMHKVGNQTGKTKDPTVQKMLKALNANISIMEKSAGVKSYDVSVKTKDAEDEKPSTEKSKETKKPKLPKVAKEDAKVATEDAKVAKEDAKVAKEDVSTTEEDAKVSEQEANMTEEEKRQVLRKMFKTIDQPDVNMESVPDTVHEADQEDTPQVEQEDTPQVEQEDTQPVDQEDTQPVDQEDTHETIQEVEREVIQEVEEQAKH